MGKNPLTRTAQEPAYSPHESSIHQGGQNLKTRVEELIRKICGATCTIVPWVVTTCQRRMLLLRQPTYLTKSHIDALLRNSYSLLLPPDRPRPTPPRNPSRNVDTFITTKRPRLSIHPTPKHNRASLSDGRQTNTR